MDDASRLCTNCGLCCDGRLFDYGLIADGEEGIIRAAELEIVDGDDGKRHFLLPCRYLEATCCTRYETRFYVCRTFRCELLRTMKRGSITLAAAMATVVEAKRLLVNAANLLGASATRGARRAKMQEVRDWRAMPHGPQREAAAKIYLELMALKLFLDRHFRSNKDKKSGARTEADQAGQPTGSLSNAVRRARASVTRRKRGA